MATRFDSPELLQSTAAQLVASYREAAAQKGGLVEELHVCDEGWQVSGALPHHPPSRAGHYTCGKVLVVITTTGVESVRQFLPVAKGMEPLLLYFR